MPELPLEDAIPRFKTNEARVDRFANGADNETWETDNGTPVPSIQKFLRDERARINEGGGSILSESRAARDASVAGAGRAEAAAGASQRSADTAGAQVGVAFSEANRAQTEANRAKTEADRVRTTLTEVALDYGTRARLAADLQNLAPGQVVAVEGISAFVDPTATGNASALHDMGVNGVRLSGRVVNARWFGLKNGVPNAHTIIAAANTYAIAQKAGANTITLLLEGVINLSQPVLLGGTQIALFHIDWSALTVNLTSGGALSSNPALFAVTCESANSQIICGRINANKISNGLRITNSGNSYVQAPNVRRYVTVGIEVTGNCAGLKVDTPHSVEWVTSDPEYFIEAAYVGTGLRADSADFVISKGQIGWCKYALWITANAGGFEAHGFHPFNGDVSGTTPRQHPFCVVNEASGPAFLYDCYIDNGYVDDRSGTLVIQGGWHLVLTNRVELNQPYTRVASNPVSAANGGYIKSFGSSIGFFNRDVFNTKTEPLVILAMGQSNMRGNPEATGGRRVIEQGVKIWTGGIQTPSGSGGWFDAAIGRYPLDASVGGSSNLAIEAANMLKRMTGRDVYVIMMAAPAAPIERFLTPATVSANGWTQDINYTTTMYPQIANALAAVPGRTTPYADAWLWHQGEANASNTVAQYRAKWLALQQEIRSRAYVSITKTVVAAGGLVPGQAGRDMIEEAIRGTNGMMLVWAESDGLAASSVPYHFSGQSLERLGVRYADAILSLNVATNSSVEAQRGRSRLAGYSARETRFIPATGDPVDDMIEKAGAGAKILVRYQPGPGDPLDVTYKTGAMAVGGRVMTSDSSNIGIGSTGALLDLYAANAIRWQMGDAALFPVSDNSVNLGRADRRVGVVYSASGSINTSDERLKTDIREVSDAEARVAQAIKGMVRAYRFRDAVAEKGDGARWHFGVIAQEVAAAFEAEELDPFAYGVVCFDQWDEQDEQLDPATGEVVLPYQPAGDRWGVRYDELMMFVISAL